MNWYNETSSLLLTTLDNLVYNILLAPDFQSSHFEGFRASHEAQHVDDKACGSGQGGDDMSPPFWCSDGWKEAEVSIPLPLPGK